MNPSFNPSQLDDPLIYHIQVQGTLDPSWSTRMEGLSIEVCHSENASTCTLLSGVLQDQAALNGVLSTLYMLGFPLLEVKTCRPTRLQCE
jgi:hypothetical protein